MATKKAATTTATVTVNFSMEKATKNTIRFSEILKDELSAPVIGTIYVPKATLGNIGWKEGKLLSVSVSVAEGGDK